MANTFINKQDSSRVRWVSNGGNGSTFDVGWLEQALLVLEYGSFRKAAEVLGVKPSVVSRRIRAFEDVLGVSLFHRRTQGAEVTFVGRRVLSRGRVILAEVEDLVRLASSGGSGREGALCVGVVSSIAWGTARELLRVFLAAHLDVDLQVVEGSPRDHLSGIRALRMDATFVVGTPPAPGCVTEPMWSEPILVALANNDPLAALDIVQWPQLASARFIVSKSDPGPEIHDYVVKQLSALGLHPIVEPRPVRRDGLMALVGLGRGVSLVGAAEAGVTYPGVVFRPLAGEMLPFSMVWSEQNDNPVLRRFLSLSRAHLKTLVRGGALTSLENPAAPGAPPQIPDPSP